MVRSIKANRELELKKVFLNQPIHFHFHRNGYINIAGFAGWNVGIKQFCFKLIVYSYLR
jgi:hypothetical protein